MIEIRPLQKSDQRKLFYSGNADLDRFLSRYAGQNQFRHSIGVTWVAIDTEHDTDILAYATISPAQLEIDDLPESRAKKLPRYPLPVLRLARLAVAEKAQGTGLGKRLLKHVLHLAQGMQQDYGCIGVVVDAKPKAIAFYEKYGFIQLNTLQGSLADRPEPLPMFLSIKDIPSC